MRPDKTPSSGSPETRIRYVLFALINAKPRPLRRVASNFPCLGSQTNRTKEFSAFRFYKKGCQEKKFPRELEAAKSFDIQPPCRCAGTSRRSSACVFWPRSEEIFRRHGHKFPNPPFPHIRKGSSERPGAVKGAPLRRGAADP